jgi:hypothetical protein
MAIVLPSIAGSKRRSVRVPHDATPSRLSIDGGPDIFPDWDRARDDAGALRRCVLCGEEHMYRRKLLPQVTGLIVVLAFTLALLSLLGYFGGPVILAIMVVVLLFDLGILFFSPESLHCYSCQAEYRDLNIGTWHKPWSRAMGRRFAKADSHVNDSDSSLDA